MIEIFTHALTPLEKTEVVFLTDEHFKECKKQNAYLFNGKCPAVKKIT